MFIRVQSLAPLSAKKKKKNTYTYTYAPVHKMVLAAPSVFYSSSWLADSQWRMALSPIGRDSYVKQLTKHIPVDSYGQCLRNKNLRLLQST